MAPLVSKVDSNKLLRDIQNEETVICTKFGKDLFNISIVMGHKTKRPQFFWPTLYMKVRIIRITLLRNMTVFCNTRREDGITVYFN